MTRMTTDLTERDARPYFLWDEHRTVAEFEADLRSEPLLLWARDIGKLMREARDRDVWRFTTPTEVADRFDLLAPHLGRKREFWEYLLDGWRRDGLLA